MTDPEKHPSLKDLDARIRQARGEQPSTDESSGSARATAMGIAWRLAIEIVVAPVVCGTLGWWLDRWFGTKHWMLVALVLLGLAAGMTNAIRVAQRASREADRDERTD